MEEYFIIWEDSEGYEVKLPIKEASYQLKMLFDKYPEGVEEMQASVTSLKEHLKKCGLMIGELVTENANLRIENHKLKLSEL